MATQPPAETPVPGSPAEPTVAPPEFNPPPPDTVVPDPGAPMDPTPIQPEV